jgi:hypothetical protein
MSNTDILRKSEAELLPPGFIQDYVFELDVGDYQGKAEVDGFHPVSREAIEICQSESLRETPKPGQKRKLASDVLKLVFLLQQGLITRGRVFVTSPELYTWFHQTGSWLSAACRHYRVTLELKQHDRKSMRKRIRNVMREAQREMRAHHTPEETEAIIDNAEEETEGK